MFRDLLVAMNRLNVLIPIFLSFNSINIQNELFIHRNISELDESSDIKVNGKKKVLFNVKRIKEIRNML